MKRVFFFFALCIAVLIGSADFAFAQSSTEEDVAIIQESQEKEDVFKVQIGDDKNVAVSRKVVFDASLSKFSSQYEDVQFTWDFGDGRFGEGVDVIHQYTRPGFYRVKLTAESGGREESDEIRVTVYEDLIVLIADHRADTEKIIALKSFAQRQGVLLDIVQSEELDSDALIQDSLVKDLIDKQQNVSISDVIMLWTGSANLGFDVLTSYQKEVERQGGEVDFSQNAIVYVSDVGFSTVTRIAQSAFDVLTPEYILLTKPAALEAVIDARDSEMVLANVYETRVENFLIGDHSVRAVSELGVTNFLSYTLNYLINQGVSRENLVLILLIPVVATIIAFTRQVIGLETFGIYIPTLITLTLFSTGVKYGLFIFLVLFVSATLLRLIIKQLKLLYLPRMALVLSLTAFVILALFVTGALSNRTGIIDLSIFPILILVILIEKFVAVQIEKGFVKSLKPSIGTVLVSVACFYIVSWEFLRSFIVAYPEVVLLTLVINVLLGRWAGLRLTEYIRFRQVNRFIGQDRK